MVTDRTDTANRRKRDPLLSLTEAAKLCGRSPQTIRHWVLVDRVLPGVRISNNRVQVRRSDIEVFRNPSQLVFCAELPPDENMLTLTEAGSLVGKSIQTMRRWILKDKILGAIRLPSGRLVVPLSELDRFCGHSTKDPDPCQQPAG